MMGRKSQLFTSLSQLKQELERGRGVPMMPITESARALIDPASVPGNGALTEDPERGLKCPIRGCNVWTHSLGMHLNMKHKGAGGCAAVREALGIPKSIALISSRQHARMRSAKLEMFAARPGQRAVYGDRARAGRTPSNGAKGVQARTAFMASATSKNLRDRCEAQLAQKLIDLHHRLGRSPSCREAAEVYGPTFRDIVTRTFGSWNHAKMRCGLERHARGCAPSMRYTMDEILEALSAWHRVHGSFPTSVDAQMPTRTPLIPEYITIRRAFGMASWGECMERVGNVLGIPLDAVGESA